MTQKTHSLISPSNYERRAMCLGSLMAEKDLPDEFNAFNTKGAELHRKTTEYIENKCNNRKIKHNWCIDLTLDEKEAVQKAGDYYLNLRKGNEKYIFHETHEHTYSLDFIAKDMQGTPDSVLMFYRDSSTIELHIIDYKFGQGNRVFANENYQLILYYLGVLKHNELEIDNFKKYNADISKFVTERRIRKPFACKIHLHIVQPYLANSCWTLTEDEVIKYSDLEQYRATVKACYAENAERNPSKKACGFCKAKAICKPLQQLVPTDRTDLNLLSDKKIAEIYDNTDLILTYLKSVDAYIRRKLEEGSFLNYSLVPKFSNRKWKDDAVAILTEKLGDDAFEVNKKLLTLAKAEKLLGVETVNELTVREEAGTQIRKLDKTATEIFATFTD